MRPIYLNDLHKDEKNLIKEGCQQLLPCRDRTGRRILTRIGNVGGPKESQTSTSIMRVNMYILQVLSSDETTQQFGCVMIFYAGFAAGETDFLKEPSLKVSMRKLLPPFL